MSLDAIKAWWAETENAAKFWIVTVVVLLLFVVISPFVGDSEEPDTSGSTVRVNTPQTTTYFSEYGGSASVYARIASLTDCAVLQEQFDIAADNNELEEPGTANHKATLGYMMAADDRLEAVGCYD